MSKILVVDDDQAICAVLKRIFDKNNYTAFSALNGKDALDIFQKENIEIVFLDINFPGMNGMEILMRMKELKNDVIVVMITGNADMKSVLEATKNGAYDYISKPFDIQHIESMLWKIKKIKTPVQNMEKAGIKYDPSNIIGKSPKMLEVFKAVAKASRTKYPVFIKGEQGSGKELVARAIHLNSDDKDDQFVVADCSNFSPVSLESELFGHEKGTFIGAYDMKKGCFETASGGTIFLNRIENISPAIQKKLLNAIQSGEITRTGSNVPVKVNARVITATDKNLKDIADAKFDKDLFSKLSVFQIDVPPLRERKEDLPLLVEFYINKNTKGSGALSVSKEAMDLIIRYDWPGNVQELENVIERAVAIAKTDTILPEDLKTV